MLPYTEPFFVSLTSVHRVADTENLRIHVVAINRQISAILCPSLATIGPTNHH